MSNSIAASTSASLCSQNEVTATSGDQVASGMEQILENEVVAGFRVWQLAGIILCVLLAIMIALCCCKRFRIPRTKQEIEANYIRKKITRSFGKELMKIKNEDMDEMDLRRALERVRAQFDAETELQRNQGESTHVAPPGFRARFNAAILHSVNMHMGRNEPKESDGVI